MWKQAGLLCLLIIILLISIDAESSEQQHKIDVRRYHGSKTSYKHRSRPPQHPQSCNDDDNEDILATCEPIHVYLLARHGTRYPTKKHASKFAKMESMLHLLRNAPDFIRKWKSPFDLRDVGLLSSIGEEELFELGHNFHRRFPKLFGDVEYHPTVFDFKSSQVARALQSAHAFAHGFFEGRGKLGKSKHQVVAIPSETQHLDRHLRFHDACPEYATRVGNNDAFKEASHHGQFSKLWIPKIAESFFARWGFDDSSDAKANGSGKETNKEKFLSTLWAACRHEASAINKTHDGICHLFNDDRELEILEFIDDLKDYWFKGPGFPINYEMSCLLVNEITKALGGATSKENVKRAHFRFAHAETLIPLIARLGLFTDHDTMASHNEVDSNEFRNRAWRSSVVSPYGSNIAFVLYRCTGDGNGASGETYKVQILHNELAQKFPPMFETCRDQYLCPLEDFASTLQSMMVDKDNDGLCDFNDICNAN